MSGANFVRLPKRDSINKALKKQAASNEENTVLNRLSIPNHLTQKTLISKADLTELEDWLNSISSSEQTLIEDSTVESALKEISIATDVKTEIARKQLHEEEQHITEIIETIQQKEDEVVSERLHDTQKEIEKLRNSIEPNGE